MTFDGNTEEKRELVTQKSREARARPGNCRAKVLGRGSEGASAAVAGPGDLRSGRMGGARAGGMPRIWLDWERGPPGASGRSSGSDLILKGPLWLLCREPTVRMQDVETGRSVQGPWPSGQEVVVAGLVQGGGSGCILRAARGLTTRVGVKEAVRTALGGEGLKLLQVGPADARLPCSSQGHS